jgi:hypothetical protein
VKLALGLFLAALVGCATPVARPAECPPCREPAAKDDAEAVRAAMRAFVGAVEARDFSASWQWLAGAWRDRYTPERLASDFEREPRGVGHVSRLKAALNAPIRLAGTLALVTLGEGRVARWVLEAGGWRLASLDSAAP